MSSAPFRRGRRSCLGLRTGVSPHFSMNSMREILALRGGYERGLLPPSSPIAPERRTPTDSRDSPLLAHPPSPPNALGATKRSHQNGCCFFQITFYLETRCRPPGPQRSARSSGIIPRLGNNTGRRRRAERPPIDASSSRDRERRDTRAALIGTHPTTPPSTLAETLDALLATATRTQH